MRPTYENEKSLQTEVQFAKAIEAFTRSELVKLPKSYGLDYCGVRNKTVVSFIEMKCRTNTVEAFEDYMISLSKILKAKDLHELTGLPCILFVRWRDAFGWADMRETFTLSVGGRKDRNDWQDTEPVCLIPIDRFKVWRL